MSTKGHDLRNIRERFAELLRTDAALTRSNADPEQLSAKIAAACADVQATRPHFFATTRASLMIAGDESGWTTRFVHDRLSISMETTLVSYDHEHARLAGVLFTDIGVEMPFSVVMPLRDGECAINAYQQPIASPFAVVRIVRQGLQNKHFDRLRDHLQTIIHAHDAKLLDEQAHPLQEQHKQVAQDVTANPVTGEPQNPNARSISATR